MGFFAACGDRRHEHRMMSIFGCGHEVATGPRPDGGRARRRRLSGYRPIRYARPAPPWRQGPLGADEGQRHGHRDLAQGDQQRRCWGRLPVRVHDLGQHRPRGHAAQRRGDHRGGGAEHGVLGKVGAGDVSSEGKAPGETLPRLYGRLGTPQATPAVGVLGGRAGSKLSYRGAPDSGLTTFFCALPVNGTPFWSTRARDPSLLPVSCDHPGGHPLRWIVNRL